MADGVFASLAGHWRVESGDDFFQGLNIEANGKFECNSGNVKDGLVRVLSLEGGIKINLKRDIPSCNDHIFDVAADHSRMTGTCTQSGGTWSLVRVHDGDKPRHFDPKFDFKMTFLDGVEKSMSEIISMGKPVALYMFNAF
jgi:hypothetical protein